MSSPSGVRRRSPVLEDGRKPLVHREDLAPPAHEAERVLALQRSAGNQAVGAQLQRERGASLQRKVRVGTKPWLANKAALPAIPTEITDAYQPYVVDQIRKLAEAWVGDRDTSNARIFDTSLALYTALAERVLAPGAAQTQSDWTRKRWDILKAAVEKEGKVTEVPWSTFSAREAPQLLEELLNCPVQVANSGRSTAFHANKHGKLPKKAGPKDKAMDELDPSDQADLTPYIEFLVAGGHKKTTGIERGILDYDAGLVYLTAHYDKGSIAWLTGVPSAVVADWRKKADDYRRVMKGEVVEEIEAVGGV